MIKVKNADNSQTTRRQLTDNSQKHADNSQTTRRQLADNSQYGSQQALCDSQHSVLTR